MALVDAADVFEPADWPPAQLDRLLWIMAGGVGRSLKAADLLVRDSNLPVLVLDLQMVPPRELQRIPSSTWHRFQRLLEETATVFVVLTPQPMVEGAACRMALHLDAELSALHRPRRELLGELSCRIFERGSLRLSA